MQKILPTDLKRFPDKMVEDFPVGSRVVLPSGKTGTVEAWLGLGINCGGPQRLSIRLDPGIDNHFRINDTVLLLPKYCRLIGKKS